MTWDQENHKNQENLQNTKNDKQQIIYENRIASKNHDYFLPQKYAVMVFFSRLFLRAAKN